MASGYTTNYDLCQWQSEDAFLREEFNGDNAKIDAALGGLRRGLDAASYNAYQLLLQAYYEGKREINQKALLFDGFWDDSMIAQCSDGLYLSEQALRLFSAVQPNIEELASSNGSLLLSGTLSSRVFTLEGAGKLETIDIRAYYTIETDSSDIKDVTLTVFLNEAQVYQTMFTANGGKTVYTITPETPIPMAAGDTVQVKLSASSNSWLRFRRSSTDESCFAVDLDFVSGSTGEGSFSSQPFPYEGTYGGASVYLRHVGEAVPTLNGTALTPVESRSITGPEGTSCTESRWSAPAGSGPITFQATLSIESGAEEACLYDYGILLE